MTLLNSADQPVTIIHPSVATDPEQKVFNLSGELSGPDAVALLVDIRLDGFTRFARRVPIEDKVNMQAQLAALNETVVSQSSSASISGAVTNGFTVEINEEGQDVPSMSISIPASSLPAGTGSLKAAIKTYSPNDPEDAQYFPGSYADSTGNGLISVAFNYAQVTTSTGETLQALEQQARIARQAPGAIGFAAPAEPVIINRTIPESSCATLEKLGDANGELAGFQIPVYTYNSGNGLWDLLGYGTLYTQDGVAVPGDATNFNCQTTTYVLEIKVTNEIFLSEWWNLDYPLQFTEPKKRCASLQIVNEAQEPLAGVYGLITGGGDFSNTYFVSDERGRANINLEVFADDVNSGNYVIWGNAGAQGLVTLSASCPATQVQTIVVKQPQLCKIKGKVEYLNKPFANLGVWAVNTSELAFTDYYFAVGATDKDGMYSLDVACNSTYTLQVLLAANGNLAGLNVDNAVGASEVSDDGKQVMAKTISFTKPPFPTTAYIGGYIAESQQGVVMFAGMYAAFPIQYNLQLKNTVTGQVIVAASGSLDFDPELFKTELDLFYLRVGQLRVPVTLPEDLTNIAVTGSITDGFGIESTVYLPVSTLPPDFLNQQ